MERPCQAPTGPDGALNRARSPPQEASRLCSFAAGLVPCSRRSRPWARSIRLERRAAVTGAPLFGAAKRTLDGVHRSGTPAPVDGRRSGNTLPLVSLAWVWFWTAGPTTAQEHTRRLITPIQRQWPTSEFSYAAAFRQISAVPSPRSLSRMEKAAGHGLDIV